MSDATINRLKRDAASGTSSDTARDLYRALLRSGETEKALAVRASIGYVEEASVLPTPTREQTRAFAEYVASAHSWYKHFSSDLKNPSRFYFYLDPGAGLSADGTILTSGMQRFHYSYRTTDEWLEEFGHWSYWVDYPKYPDGTYGVFSNGTDLVPKLVEPEVTAAKFRIRAEFKDFLLDLPSSLIYYADVTNHVHSATFKVPKTAIKHTVENYFNNDRTSEEYGWRETQRKDRVLRRLCLRRMHQAQLGFLEQLETEVNNG